MSKISILKVENPSCLWGRLTEMTEHYSSLWIKMNQFYGDVTLVKQKQKPTSLEKGQVYVVFWTVKNLWCRALVESTIMDSLSCQACCLLVDHGERIMVSSEQVYVALSSFLQLPAWVRKFRLARIKPTTMKISLYKEKAKLKPSASWNSSATLYLHNLLLASTQTEAALLEMESDSTPIELYLTIDNVKICVNDDLVGKMFAYYTRDSTGRSELCPVGRVPFMLSTNILAQDGCRSPKKQAAQTEQHFCEHTVMSQSSDSDETGETAACSLLQRKLPVVISCDEDDNQISSQKRPRRDSGTAETDSDSSEENDSSLAAVLAQNLDLFRFLKFLNHDTSSPQDSSSVSPNDEMIDNQPQEVTEWLNTSPESRQQDTSKLPKTLFTTVEQQQHNSAHDSTLSGANDVLHRSNVENAAFEETSLNELSESEPEAEEVLRTEEDRVCSRLNELSESEPEAEEVLRTEEDRVCSRLLEWLNPNPLNPNPDAVNDISLQDTIISEVLVHSALSVETCNTLGDAPITDVLRKMLLRNKFDTLSPAERYSWPMVARGCNTLIITPNADNPLSYLAPLLSHILLNSIFTSQTTYSGPIAVLLCSGWEKAQAVYDLLEEAKLSQSLCPVIVLLGVGKDEAKAVKIPKNCLLLVTTPFTLVRLLSCHCFLFLRLCHLVLDEADHLFELAPDEMETILKHFQRVTCNEENAFHPQQLVAIAKCWTSHMEGLISGHMSDPCIIITAPEEAALYGNVQQVIFMTPEVSKISVLLSVLDLNPDVGQKTVVVANSAQEVEDVFKAVNNKSAFCLKTHEGITHENDFVIEQWRKDIGPGTHVILVTTSACLRCLGIRDATCLVHFGFPTSPKQFGSRFFCMSENFRNLSQQVCSQDPRKVARSVMLISEGNARHVLGVERYLKRTNAPLPPELVSFAQEVHAIREHLKADRPLCNHLKRFGFCRNSSVCPDRHKFSSQLDQSELPASGLIEVVPLHIKSASVFYGHVIRKDDSSFKAMTTEMAAFYADRKPGASDLLLGGLYAVQQDQEFHRVKILSLNDRDDRLFFTVMVSFIDVGKEEEVKSHEILQLPDQFQSLPGQAVEIIFCGVKPADAEADWHPKVTRVIHHKIRGLQHQARAVLSLGNTVFVDSLVRVTKIPGTKTLINEYNVQSEILNTGMGVCNPEHVGLLKALCQDDLANGSIELGCTVSDSFVGGRSSRGLPVTFLGPRENGPRFSEDTGEINLYVYSDSDEESDSPSTFH
ncbi:putative ATP-dependent RNA helicase TDRD12 isoform X2 [Nothobranchius furzeri]